MRYVNVAGNGSVPNETARSFSAQCWVSGKNVMRHKHGASYFDIPHNMEQTAKTDSHHGLPGLPLVWTCRHGETVSSIHTPLKSNSLTKQQLALNVSPHNKL